MLACRGVPRRGSLSSTGASSSPSSRCPAPAARPCRTPLPRAPAARPCHTPLPHAPAARDSETPPVPRSNGAAQELRGILRGMAAPHNRRETLRLKASCKVSGVKPCISRHLASQGLRNTQGRTQLGETAPCPPRPPSQRSLSRRSPPHALSALVFPAGRRDPPGASLYTEWMYALDLGPA